MPCVQLAARSSTVRTEVDVYAPSFLPFRTVQIYKSLILFYPVIAIPPLD